MSKHSAAYPFLHSVVATHLDHALHLLSLEAQETDDSRRTIYHPAAATQFMAGIDKALSLAMILLFVVDPKNVTWSWLCGDKKKDEAPRPGSLVCVPGFRKKVNKLRAMGFAFDRFDVLSELRNWMIHHCEVTLGYAQTLRDVDNQDYRRVLRSHAPHVSWTVTFQSRFTSQSLRDEAEYFCVKLADFIDAQGFEARWTSLCNALLALPEQFPPVSADHDEVCSIIDSLNRTHLGDDLGVLLGQLLRYSRNPLSEPLGERKADPDTADGER